MVRKGSGNLSQSNMMKMIGLIVILLWVTTIVMLYLKDERSIIEIFQLNALDYIDNNASISTSMPQNTSLTTKLEEKINHNIDQKNEEKNNENADENEQTMDKYPFLLKSIKNQINGKIVQCNPMKYKYFRLLLHDLDEYFNILNKKRIKTTRMDIDKDTQKWCNHKGNEFHRRQRIQIIDDEIFISNNGYYKYGNDQEGYTTSILLYLKSLMNKYSKSIDNTDFIWHYHDVKTRKYVFKSHIWKNNGTIPYFWTDADIIWNDNDDITQILFGVSRNYMKYRYFSDNVYDEWKKTKNHKYKKGSLLNKSNYARIRDYLEYKDYLTEHTQNMSMFNWSNKPYNRALFVGGESGTIRKKFLDVMLHDEYVHNLTKEYFDINWQYVGFNISEQMKYKYMIVFDGNSVRDGMFYQLEFGTVLLKQLTTIYEWWLFDLVNHRDVIFFENILHLISIVTNMVDQVNGYYLNKKINDGNSKKQFKFLTRNDEGVIHKSDYNPDKLEKIAMNGPKFMDEYLNEESVDCYMINMLRVYNHYLFDSNSVTKSDIEDCKMTKLILND